MTQFRTPMLVFAAVLGTILGMCAPVSADRITLRGTSIALPECDVEAIEQGRVVYRDRAGRQQRTEIDQVSTISFSGLPLLDEAEGRIEAGALADGVWLLLRALIETESEVAELWIRARLARMHDARGEYAEAAAHVASIIARDEHTHWLSLSPVREPDGSTLAATREALAQIEAARRHVRHDRLRDLLEVMRARLIELQEKLADQNGGAEAPKAGEETISGVPVEDIRADRRPARWRSARTVAARSESGGEPLNVTSLNEEPADAEVPTASAEAASAAEEAGAALTRADRASPDELDRLLDRRQWEKALRRCEQIAARPGARALARFLHQYGRALRGAGRALEAAVMFTRGALLHPGDEYAVRGLIETAAIYRDVVGRPDAAARLLDRAAEQARAMGRDDLVEITNTVRRTLDEDSSRRGNGSNAEAQETS